MGRNLHAKINLHKFKIIKKIKKIVNDMFYQSWPKELSSDALNLFRLACVVTLTCDICL